VNIRDDRGLRARGLILLIAIAGIVYLFGANTGSKQTMYVDEAFYDRYALELAQWLTNAGSARFSLAHPSGYSMVLAGLYGIWYILGRMLGEFRNIDDFLVHFAVQRCEFILVGRWLSAIFAVAALPAVVLAGERLFSRRVGLLAGAATLVCYPMVFYSHIAANITMLACLSSWTLYWTVRVWKDGEARSYAVAGVLIGAGVGTKYYPALLGLPLLVAHVYGNTDRRSDGVGRALFPGAWKLALAFALALPVALLLFPIPILEPGEWAREMRDAMGYYKGGGFLENARLLAFGSVPVFERTTAEPVSWWSNSMRVLSPVGLAWVLTGIFYGLAFTRRAATLLASPFIIFFSYQALRGGLGLGVRQLYFLLPWLWVLAATALDDVTRRTMGERASSVGIFALVAMLLLLQPAWWTLRFLVLSSRPTTVDVARSEMLRLISADAVLLVDSGAAPFGETVGWSENRSVAGPAGRARRQAAPPFEVRELGSGDANTELAAVVKSGRPIYVVLTDYFSTGYWDSATIRAWGNINAGRAAERRKYLSDLALYTTTVAEYSPRALRALGPKITLLKVRD
jgi:Dolichyl-phosphate-mannose-protein mannosyltransferase